MSNQNPYRNTASVSTQGASDELAWREGRSTVTPKPLDWLSQHPDETEAEYVARTGRTISSGLISIEARQKIANAAESSTTKPAHYNDSQLTPLQVIDDWQLNFRLGNVVKYIARHLKKGTPLLDLEKAAEYLQLEIKRLKGLDV